MLNKAPVFCFFLLTLFLPSGLLCQIPVIDIAALPLQPDENQAAVAVIITAWAPDLNAYKEIARDPKAAVEDLNILAILSSKSGKPMKDIWHWRKLHVDWQEILEKLNLSLDDFIPRSEKRWQEPYLKCWSYWRDKGSVKYKCMVADYDFEKLADVVTLQKYSTKTVDAIVEQLVKGESFRSLSGKFYVERNSKGRRK
jgi:hypothetical protein